MENHYEMSFWVLESLPRQPEEAGQYQSKILTRAQTPLAIVSLACSMNLELLGRTWVQKTCKTITGREVGVSMLLHGHVWSAVQRKCGRKTLKSRDITRKKTHVRGKSLLPSA
jgi:hypothetical protein